ncbi:N-acetyl-gamma-glutamyl-phosphate reductase [Pseudomonadota bacterium]
MNSVVVIGARGYTGAELLPLIYKHPDFEITAVSSGSAAGQLVSTHIRGLAGSDLVFSDIRPAALTRLKPDACVLALPNGLSDAYVDALDASSPATVIVDLSADHRFDAAWAYGQPERFVNQLNGASRIANPGCYATGGQLALAPLLDSLIGTPAIFGVSGYSGAGKTPSPKNDPDVLKDNLLPYALVDHIHEKEVSHHIGRDVRFMPHVAPFFRGITLSVAAELRQATTEKALMARYREYYAGFPLVEVRETIPEVRQVRGRHQVLLGGFAVSEHNPCRVGVVAVLDNLLKGAATQAVQNLNLAFGLDSMKGLNIRMGEPS